MDGITHRVAEERSLALHREVVRRLSADPGLLDRARERIARWRRDGRGAPFWVEAWAEVLTRPFDGIVEGILDPSDFGCSLRQSTPFAGVIDPATRWEILRECERERRARDQGTA